MTIANITDNYMTNLVERFYDNVDENDIAQSEVFEEFLDVAKEKCGNIWSDDDLHWIANYVWNDYWSNHTLPGTNLRKREKYGKNIMMKKILLKV